MDVFLKESLRTVRWWHTTWMETDLLLLCVVNTYNILNSSAGLTCLNLQSSCQVLIYLSLYPDMAVNIESLLDNIPERQRDMERKQVRCCLGVYFISPFLLLLMFTPSPALMLRLICNRWTLWYWCMAQSWGLSTGSTAASAMSTPHTMSSCWLDCSSGVCSKTATSTTTTSLWPRLTV